MMCKCGHSFDEHNHKNIDTKEYARKFGKYYFCNHDDYEDLYPSERIHHNCNCKGYVEA